MVELTINGRRYSTENATHSLLVVLRDELGLVGAKEGCGIGICGACTVLMDGDPVSSCLLLAGQVAGKEILTVEGLSPAGELHPLQQVFIEQFAFQCAYCTPGFVLTALALLRENPFPTEEAIREYLAGNLCRCGSYPNILTSIQEATRGERASPDLGRR